MADTPPTTPASDAPPPDEEDSKQATLQDVIERLKAEGQLDRHRSPHSIKALSFHAKDLIAEVREIKLILADHFSKTLAAHADEMHLAKLAAL